MLDDGRGGTTEVKVVTGVDDHSRFCVIAAVVARATGRAVCLAFAEALTRYGVPEEVLTDNGKQFTARFGRGGELLFDRICRDNAIAHRLTPTTTGKICEDWASVPHRPGLTRQGMTTVSCVRLSTISCTPTWPRTTC